MINKAKTINNPGEKVYSLVRSIPSGKVATYKQLAQLVGITNPRQIGFILHNNPFEEDVPCHRVVSSTGKVAKTFAFGGADAQQKLLENEGVVFSHKRVNLIDYLWNPFAK